MSRKTLLTHALAAVLGAVVCLAVLAVLDRLSPPPPPVPSLVSEPALRFTPAQRAELKRRTATHAK